MYTKEFRLVKSIKYTYSRNSSDADDYPKEVPIVKPKPIIGVIARKRIAREALEYIPNTDLLNSDNNNDIEFESVEAKGEKLELLKVKKARASKPEKKKIASSK